MYKDQMVVRDLGHLRLRLKNKSRGTVGPPAPPLSNQARQEAAQMRKEQAFTLIELLIVMAILTILAGILFTVFAGAKEKARQTHCMNNLKQLGAAILLYKADYDGGWPPAVFKIYPHYVTSRELFVCPDDGIPKSWRKKAEEAGLVYTSYGACPGDNLGNLSGDFLRRLLTSPSASCEALARATLKYRYSNKLPVLQCSCHLLPGVNCQEHDYTQRLIDAKVHSVLIYLWQDGRISVQPATGLHSINSSLGIPLHKWWQMEQELADQLARERGCGNNDE